MLAGALAALQSHQQAAVASWLDEHPGYDIRDLIKHSLLSAFDYLSENPAVARLLAWEGLESGADSRALWSTHQGPLFEQLTAMLVQAQTECHLDTRFDPDHLAVCLLGALGHHITHGHTYVGIHRLGATHPDTLARQRLQLLLILDALLLE